jgi:signal transduction histidine kinase
MTFRARVLLAAIPLALLPLAIFAIAVRSGLGGRLEAQYREQVAATVALIGEDLERRGAALATRLDALALAAAEDNALRAAVLQAPAEERRVLLDWAPRALAASGLDLLQLQDGAGRILSSGHFRNEYDRTDAATLGALRGHPDGPVLLRARTAQGSMVALARVRPLRFGATTLWLTGGEAVDARFIESLVRAPELSLALRWPADSLTAGAPAHSAADVTVEERVTMPFVDAVEGANGEATFAVAHSNAPLAELRRRIDRWLVVATALTALLALLLARWIAARVTQPLADLARTASRIDLERLDVRFPARRADEIGTLARVLDAMTERLRAGAVRLRDAERRATVGELARQVNHDIKNGLVPIRNVVRHLAEVASGRPAEVATVFADRRGTLESGIAYLDALASNYARLSPRAERQPCDLNAIVRAVLTYAARDGDRARADLDDRLPAVVADPVALRRIVENLVVNALESLNGKKGAVTVSTRLVAGGDGGRVLLDVDDTGAGMTADELRRAFEDFYTTKERGTGLGLSIVRRLVADLGGSVRVESEPGRGTRVRVELGAAP